MILLPTIAFIYYLFTADIVIIPAIAYICAFALTTFAVSRAAQRISRLKRDLRAAEKRAEDAEGRSLKLSLPVEAMDTWKEEGKMWEKGTDNQEAWVKTIMQRGKEEIERLRAETGLREQIFNRGR